MVTILLVRYGGERAVEFVVKRCEIDFREFRLVKVVEIRMGRFESLQKCAALGCTGGEGVDRIARDTIVACMRST